MLTGFDDDCLPIKALMGLEAACQQQNAAPAVPFKRPSIVCVEIRKNGEVFAQISLECLRNEACPEIPDAVRKAILRCYSGAV